MSFNHTQQGTPLPTTGTTSYTTVATPTAHFPSAGANAPFASGIIAPPPGPIRKKPKPAAKTRPSKQLSKSLSTPQLRGPIMSDAELDKKRNKLGYQRISIACAHCRRRKIRCLVADEDPEGRCQNCIRLKKDCVFYPVDQQAALDARPETLGKPGMAPTAPSSTVSSSPSHGDARSFDQHAQRFGGGFQHLPPSVSSGGYQGIPIAPNTALQPQGNYATPDHGYSSQPEASIPWSPQEFGQPNQPMPIREPSNMPQPWPRYNTPDTAADTAPFPRPSDHPPRNLQPAQNFPYIDQQWHVPPHQHPPVRSMSVPGYSNHEMPPSYQPGQQPSEPQMRNAYNQQQPGPHMVPVTPTQPVYHGQPAPYSVPHDQRSSSIPFVQQPYPHPPAQIQPGWYGNAPPFTQGEQPRTSHSSQQGNYQVRPS